MFKKLSKICLFLIFTHAEAQEKPSFNVNSEVSIMVTVNNDIMAQRFSMLSIRPVEKSNLSEGSLTIKRIKRKLIIDRVEYFEKDTLRSTPEEVGAIDTDFPIPNNEDEKSIIENLMLFVNTPIKIKENPDGIFNGQKLKKGAPDILSYFNKKIPTLNKNPFLSSVLLNFIHNVNTYTDTTFSNIYGGIFITKYSKTNEGFDVEGELKPIKQPEVKEIAGEYEAQEIYSKFKYKGKLITSGDFINKMDLNIEFKSTLILKIINLNEEKEEKYRLVVNNEFN